MLRALAGLVLVVAGAATGLASVALHPHWWGLLLAVAATLTALVALPAGWATRLAFGLGWVLVVGWLASPRGEGDFLISQDAPGLLLLGMGLLVVVFAVATLPARGRAGSESDGPRP